MTMLIVLLALAAVASTARLVRTIASDGYGQRPAPLSHPYDQAAPSPAYTTGLSRR